MGVQGDRAAKRHLTTQRTPGAVEFFGGNAGQRDIRFVVAEHGGSHRQAQREPGIGRIDQEIERGFGQGRRNLALDPGWELATQDCQGDGRIAGLEIGDRPGNRAGDIRIAGQHRGQHPHHA